MEVGWKYSFCRDLSLARLSFIEITVIVVDVNIRSSTDLLRSESSPMEIYPPSSSIHTREHIPEIVGRQSLCRQ